MTAPLSPVAPQARPESQAGGYSVSQAARLVRIAPEYVRRYARQHGGDGGPWGAQRYGREFYLVFRDLMELRVAKAFHELGVPWPKVRQAAHYAARRFGDERYPLSHRRFITDAHHIFDDSPSGLESITENGQYALAPLLSALVAPVEYDAHDAPRRWRISQEWGIGNYGAAVVIDPLLSFGAPVIGGCNVPTAILYDASIAEQGDLRTVADNYQVTVAQVRLAYRFERLLRGQDAVSA